MWTGSNWIKEYGPAANSVVKHPCSDSDMSRRLMNCRIIIIIIIKFYMGIMVLLLLLLLLLFFVKTEIMDTYYHFCHPVCSALGGRLMLLMLLLLLLLASFLVRVLRTPSSSSLLTYTHIYTTVNGRRGAAQKWRWRAL